jgi:hypothetical protein
VYLPILHYQFLCEKELTTKIKKGHFENVRFRFGEDKVGLRVRRNDSCDDNALFFIFFLNISLA